MARKHISIYLNIYILYLKTRGLVLSVFATKNVGNPFLLPVSQRVGFIRITARFIAAERFFRLSKVGRLHTYIYQSCVVYRPNATNGAIFHLSIVITLIPDMYSFEFFFLRKSLLLYGSG